VHAYEEIIWILNHKSKDNFMVQKNFIKDYLQTPAKNEIGIAKFQTSWATLHTHKCLCYLGWFLTCLKHGLGGSFVACRLRATLCIFWLPVFPCLPWEQKGKLNVWLHQCAPMMQSVHVWLCAWWWLFWPLLTLWTYLLFGLPHNTRGKTVTIFSIIIEI
jgi:hypothetical protein